MPETLEAPPVSTPDPAPAQPTPAPAPAGGSQPPPELSQDVQDIEAAWSKIEPKEDKAPEPKPEPEKKVEAKAPEALKKEQKPPATASEPPKKERSGEAMLRAQREKEKTEFESERAELKKMITAQEAKIKEAEEKGKNTSAMEAKLAEMEKAHKELQAELSVARFSASEDYKSKYQQPFDKLINKTNGFVKTLVRPDGQQASFADFEEVLQSSNALAPAKARELFGEDYAQEILSRRRQLLDLNEEAQEAIASERTNWETNNKKREEAARYEQLQQQKRQNEERELFQKVIQDIQTSVDDYRDPVGEDKDEEMASLRQKAYEMFDARPQDLQQHFTKLAHMRHRFAAHDAMKLKITRLETALAEANKKLEDSKPNLPSPGGNRKPASGGAAPAVDPLDEMKQALRGV